MHLAVAKRQYSLALQALFEYVHSGEGALEAAVDTRIRKAVSGKDEQRVVRCYDEARRTRVRSCHLRREQWRGPEDTLQFTKEETENWRRKKERQPDHNVREP
jgi:hypothetical protein